MGQITLYIDPTTEERIRKAAKHEGKSLSRWVCDLLRDRTTDEWPDSFKRLAGAWSDAPTSEELRKGEASDIEREQL